MKIIANKELFDRWKSLGLCISHQSSIVQNDMEVSADEIIEWRYMVFSLYRELKQLENDTLSYCGLKGLL